MYGNRSSSIPALANVPMDNRGALIDAQDELPITSAANSYTVQGSRTVTRLPAWPRDTTVQLQFTGTPTFKNSSRLILTGGVDKTFAAGDAALCISAGDGVWRVFPLGSTSAIPDVDRQNASLDRIYQSKSLGDVRRVIQSWATGFKASTDTLRGILTASSSNVDASNAAASGYVAPSSTTTVTTSGGNPPASAAASLGTTGILLVNETTALPNSATIVSIGLYSDVATSVTMKIVKRNSSTSVDVVVSQAFSHPGGGWADLTITSPYTVPATGTYYVGAYYTSDPAAKYNSSTTRLSASSNLTGTGQTVAESTGSVHSYRASQATVYDNMTLVTATQTADASASNARVIMEIDNTATPILNTDITAEVTCNGGTNWTAATLASVGAGQAGRLVVETADTACTAGTSVSARIKTLNNKNIPTYGTSITWR